MDNKYLSFHSVDGQYLKSNEYFLDDKIVYDRINEENDTIETCDKFGNVLFSTQKRLDDE